MKEFPTQIQPSEGQNLKLAWSSGAEFTIPYRNLRFECPCAACVDEMTGARRVTLESIPQDVRPKKVEQVGRYAIKIVWSDDHSTGIYAFERLHDLCLSIGTAIH